MLLECSSVITQRSTIVWMAAMTLEEEASSQVVLVVKLLHMVRM